MGQWPNLDTQTFFCLGTDLAAAGTVLLLLIADWRPPEILHVVRLPLMHSRQ